MWCDACSVARLVQEALVVCLRGVLRERLARVGWPPPVAARPGSSGSLGGGSEPDVWRGLEAAHPQVCHVSKSSTVSCCRLLSLALVAISHLAPR